jgi:hypothetical protein
LWSEKFVWPSSTVGVSKSIEIASGAELPVAVAPSWIDAVTR